MYSRVWSSIYYKYLRFIKRDSSQNVDTWPRPTPRNPLLRRRNRTTIYRPGFLSSFIARAVLSILIAAVISPTLANASSGHHHKCTQLWVFTFPVQKGPCISFRHPTGSALTRANNANIQYNLGVSESHKALQENKFTSVCPAGHTKSYCEGWESRGGTR